MNRLEMSDHEWFRLLPQLKNITGICIGNLDNLRRFIAAVLWILRSGAQWRTLPKSYGKWNSVFKRFSRWCEIGVWDRLLKNLSHSTL